VCNFSLGGTATHHRTPQKEKHIMAKASISSLLTKVLDNAKNVIDDVAENANNLQSDITGETHEILRKKVKDLDEQVKKIAKLEVGEKKNKK
jgi:uncharacterized protein YoxC